MGRKGWIIAAAGIVLIVSSIIAVMALTGRGGWRNMQGPVGIVKGPMPKNGFLGVGFDMHADGAAKITEVIPGSGAAEAGLREGDEIIQVQDVADPSATVVQRMTVTTKPGDMFPFRIRRDGEEKDVSVRLISFEEMIELTAAQHRKPASRQTTTAPASIQP
jgi:S1-C subfamily serine protease